MSWHTTTQVASHNNMQVPSFATIPHRPPSLAFFPLVYKMAGFEVYILSVYGKATYKPIILIFFLSCWILLIKNIATMFIVVSMSGRIGVLIYYGIIYIIKWWMICWGSDVGGPWRKKSLILDSYQVMAGWDNTGLSDGIVQENLYTHDSAEL